jgi:hypothetical protein
VRKVLSAVLKDFFPVQTSKTAPVCLASILKQMSQSFSEVHQYQKILLKVRSAAWTVIAELGAPP